MTAAQAPRWTVAAHRELLDQLPVEPQLDLVLLADAANLVLIRPLQHDPHRVFAVEREIVPDRQPAARSERQILADPVGSATWCTGTL